MGHGKLSKARYQKTTPDPSVTREEAEAVIEYGHARILGRLGQSVRYFPTPPWADRRRAPVVGADEKRSILGCAIPRMYRVIGPLSNTSEFQRAFSCGASAPMVRQHPCEVW
jgi:hypothetical protein